MHCTCPVCRFELETEDKDYERDRRVRMRGRRPRYRRRELDGLTIPQVASSCYRVLILVERRNILCCVWTEKNWR